MNTQTNPNPKPKPQLNLNPKYVTPPPPPPKKKKNIYIYISLGLLPDLVCIRLGPQKHAIKHQFSQYNSYIFFITVGRI